jgi:hypothetical protein
MDVRHVLTMMVRELVDLELSIKSATDDTTRMAMTTEQGAMRRATAMVCGFTYDGGYGAGAQEWRNAVATIRECVKDATRGVDSGNATDTDRRECYVKALEFITTEFQPDDSDNIAYEATLT